ncbi:MAG TPA: hypothetical protein VEY88_17925 [Archangium sp.]|nr:hypothetical protein [Archangium sp.]
MSQTGPKVTQETELWVLRVQQPNGKVQEYRCTSEGQVRQLAQILSATLLEQGAQPQA